MAAFIARRLLAAFFVVLASSFIVYVMMAYAGDPLAFLIEIQDANQRRARSSRRSRDEPQPRHARGRSLLPVARRHPPRRLRNLCPHPAPGVGRPQVPRPDDAQARRGGDAPVDHRRHLRRHDHGDPPVLRLRLPRLVLHVRVLLAARCSGWRSSSRASAASTSTTGCATAPSSRRRSTSSPALFAAIIFYSSAGGAPRRKLARRR